MRDAHPARRRLTAALFLFAFAGWLAALPSPARAQTGGSGTFLIEAEDYNYNGGQTKPAASVMPYYGGAYAGLSATYGIDYTRPDDGSSPAYRNDNRIPMTDNGGDLDRGPWSVTVNYRLGWIGDGMWFNYTRTFPSGYYKVYAALSYGDTSPGGLRGSMQRVTSGATTTTQTLEALGSFEAPGTGTWGLNALVPMKDAAGKVALVQFNGTQTVRFTAASGDIDYYKFVTAGPPQISQQPADVTVVENRPGTFTIGVANEDPVNYQWQSNQVNVAGATNASYTLSPPLGANGARFRCVLGNPLGTNTSSEATLHVTADTVRPRLLRAISLGATSIQLTFDEGVAIPGGTVGVNFALDHGAAVSAVAAGPTRSDLLLTVSPLSFGTTYTVTVNNVTDLAATPNAILPNSTASFVASEYAPADIGAPSQPGSVVRLPEGGFDVTGGGTDIGGTSDQFQFGWEQRTGNFDLQVRVANVDVTDPFLHAGLMVRESLDSGARFAAIFASSAQLGCFFESRTGTGAPAGTAAPATGFPVNYPRMWLRLRRAGNDVTGYASFDARGWTQLGTVNLSSLPAKVYFGLAVSSANAAATTTARFRDLGATPVSTLATYTLPVEWLAASSRRTGMVISEIMYHPATRTDALNLAFIELYNARSVAEDLSGWRLSGDVDYRFPDGFQLPAGGFVAIAAAPADLKTFYGITNVLGPYTNALSHAAGTIRLRNAADAIRLEVNYSGDPPWPAAADGAGHSLVLARPSYGEADPQAWAASESIGGSPGGVDSVDPTPLRNVVINELLAHTDPPALDAVELYNHAPAAVDLSGCWLTDDPTTNKFRVPDNTQLPARGFIAFDENQLGFALNAAGEGIYLLNSNATRVLDAFKFGGQDNGIALGRYPDGSPTLRRLANPTLGTANSPARPEDIVINEIMFDPISGNRDDEYIELFNRTSHPTNLARFKFTDGIDFSFPTGAELPANGYLVVARNAARLLTNYTQLNAANTIGDYSGSLKNGGGRVALARHEELVSTNALGDLVTNLTWVVVAEARYGSGGRWGTWAGGGGSSLELIDPHADPLETANWRTSDESSKAAWTPFTFTGPLDNGNGSYPPDMFNVTMLGGGECLVDDLEIFKTGGANLLGNGGFENGATGWEFRGNHSRSSIDTAGAASGQRCLHVRGQEDGDTGVNTVRTPISGLADGNTVTIRGKVRWLAGWPEILFRVHGNYVEAPVRMTLPANLGTPGLPNSRLVANAGPAIHAVAHAPLLPRANQAVTVTARVEDPDGVKLVVMRYRVDPSATVTTVPMRDDGVAPDAVANDGIYSATLPARGGGTLVAFRIEASDQATGSSIFPADAPTRECLVRWDDPIPFGNFPHYHLWNTAATEDARGSSGTALDNTYRDATLVYGNSRVIYNVGFRDKGSPWHGGSGDFIVDAPADDALLGATERAFASTGNGGSEPTAIRSQLAAWLAQQLGLPYLHAAYMLLYRNGGAVREVMEDLEVPNNNYAEAWFPPGENGDLYKVSMWFEFENYNFGAFSAINATIEPFRSQNAYKLARYRWIFKRRPLDGFASNYTNLFDLVTVANDTTTNYVSRFNNLADTEQWMRVYGFDRMMGNWDSWSFSVGQNMYAYKQPGERWVLMPWDIDFTFGLGEGPGGSLWGGQDPVINRMYDEPAFRRALWRTYQDAINGPYQPQRYQPQIDNRRRVLLQNNIPNLSDPGSITTYIEQRRGFLQSQLTASDAASFAITSNNGNNFTSSTSTTLIAGNAPFAVATIEVNGTPYPVTWTSPNAWSIAVPLTQVTNVLTFVGRDRLGAAWPGSTDTITVVYRGAVPQPQDFVVLNEIHYNPLEPRASFVELFNRSTTTPFDLSGFQLEGVGYTFPDGAILGPNAYLVLVKDRAQFAAAYGQTVPVFDVFPGSLDNNGEHLALVKPGATPAQDVLISDVRYDHHLPWPTNADGFGPSLQLVDPAQDEYRVGNWTATATNDVNRVTPARANAGRQTLTAFPPVWINEVLPQNLTGATDTAGDRDPWIELYNAGAADLDLSSYYLTDTYTNLTKWKFPAGTTIVAHSFLVIWADGEPAEGSAASPHTSFRLNSTAGSVALVRLQGTPSTAAVMDYLDYILLTPDRSFGAVPDGEPRGRRVLYYPTPGAPNNPATPPIEVTINEFMAANTHTLIDPATGHFDDWFELYNAGSNTVDLASYRLTDNLTNRTQFVIPPGFAIPPGGFLLVWADDKAASNSPPGLDLHVNFKLSKSAGAIGLYAVDGTLVDGFTYGQQLEDVSMGRVPDGEPLPLYAMETPTPRTGNVLAGGNRPPVLDPIADRVVPEMVPVRFTAHATDPDAGQSLTYSLGVDAPPAAAIDPVTGEFFWTPTETDGPGVHAFTVRATDNGTPPRTAGQRVTLTVEEVNRPPQLTPVGDRMIDEGALLALQFEATDADLPRQTLTFAFNGTVPTGVSLDPATGAFSWRPTEAQGPGAYDFTLVVTDNGAPPLNDTNRFRVTVNEINSPPVIDPVLPQTIVEGATFSVTIRATDPDSVPSPIVFSLDAAPASARIDAATGVITWLTTEADGPTNVVFVVRATETNPPQPSAAITFGVTVTEANQPPTLGVPAELGAIEGQLVTFAAQGHDADLPPQTLSYRLLDSAPAGASIDPASGLFRWTVDDDLGAGTNRIGIVVADDGPGRLTTTQTVAIVVQPQWHAVINEIMDRPARANAEFIELFNNSGKTTMELAGVQLAGSNLNFTFPAGARLTPGAFTVVARNLTAFAGTYPGAGPVAGAYTGSFGSAGDTLRLLRPQGDSSLVLDEVTFRKTAPWPVAANGGGGSLQLIDPSRDNNRAGNWGAIASNTLPTIPEWKFVTATGSAGDPRLYLYLDRAGSVDIDDIQLVAGSTAGVGPNLIVNGDFEAPLANGWNLTDNTGNSTIGTTVRHGGTGSLHLVCKAAGSTSTDCVLQSVGGLTSGATYTLSFWYLPNPQGGTLTARFSGRWISATADVLITPGAPLPQYTPGKTNIVDAGLDRFPTLRINEVVARNVTGLTDHLGQHEPWIELINDGLAEVSLDGLALSDSYASPGKSPFPSGLVIPAGGFLVVFADGQPEQAQTGELHTNFRLSDAVGTRWSVVLARINGAATEVIDYLDGLVDGDDMAIGRLPDGDPASAVRLPAPSPGVSNEQPMAPVITAMALTPEGWPRFAWTAGTGWTYRVEGTTDPASGSWLKLADVVSPGLTAAYTDSTATGLGQRFYRVVFLHY